MKKEIWKGIPNYDNYEVSDLGRVRSLDRVGSDGRRLKGKVLRVHNCFKGYRRVTIKVSTKYVHQLVAMAFLGHVPNGHSLVVDHIDNDKLNNKPSNLQITTPRHNTSKDRVGTSNYTGVSWAKTKNKWVSRIRINGRLIYLGYFINELEASKAYQKKLKEISK